MRRVESCLTDDVIKHVKNAPSKYLARLLIGIILYRINDYHTAYSFYRVGGVLLCPVDVSGFF